MIEFASVIQVDSASSDDILILAEPKYDGNVLGNSSNWVIAPYLAAPVEFSSMTSQIDASFETAYVKSLKDSGIALLVLKVIVDLSNAGRKIIIGCYDYNIKRSHLSVLFDAIEELFVSDAPELQMLGV